MSALRWFVGNMFMHFLIGVCFCLASVLLNKKMEKRHWHRRLYRFRGDSPLSLGSGNAWLGFYVFCLFFELLTSWLMHEKYLEVALSPFQAVFMTLGLFVVDRLAMAFIEAEKEWLPKDPNVEVGGAVVVAEATADPLPKADLWFVSQMKKSWSAMRSLAHYLFSGFYTGGEKQPSVTTGKTITAQDRVQKMADLLEGH